MSLDRLPKETEITATVTTDVRTLVQKLADSGNLYSATTDFVSTALTGEVPFYLLKNPAGSGVLIKVDSIWRFTQAASNWKFRTYLNPTITADGTGLAETNWNVASSNTASGEAYKFPTISANGTLLQPQHGQDDKHQDPMQEGMELSLILGEGDSMLITHDNVKNIVTAITVRWGEL